MVGIGVALAVCPALKLRAEPQRPGGILRPFTKVHYYAFLMDALARFPQEGLQVGTPSRLISVLRRRHGAGLRANFLDAVVERLKAERILDDREGSFIAEFGVYKGHSINHLARHFPDHRIYGFDSFEGFPADGRTDWQSDFSVPGLPEVPNNVTLIKGYFEETVPRFKAQLSEDAHLKFAHIDCDLYSSTATVFQELGDLFSPGSIILFDELLNYRRFAENEFLAFYEFLLKRNMSFEWYVKRGDALNFRDYCHKLHNFPMKEHRQKGFYQYAAVRLTEDNGLLQRCEAYRQDAVELAQLRKRRQELSPVYAKTGS